MAKQGAKASLMEKLTHLDPLGVALVMAAMICFILALQYGGQTYAWTDSRVIGLLVGFVVIACVFIGWEIWLGDWAMIPRHVYARRIIWATSLFQFFFAGSYFVSLYYLPIYFQSVDGVSPIASGVRNLPLIITASVFLILTGILVAKLNRPAPVMVFGSALATVACGLFYTFDDKHTGPAKWIGYQVLAGVAWGSAFQMAIITVQATASPHELSTITSINYCKYTDTDPLFRL